MDTVFKKTDILLPRYASDSDEWVTWSVIACDQHTSEPSYWDETKRIVKGAPSTLDLVLPEAYLGNGAEAKQKENIKRAPEKFGDSFLKKYEGSLVYVERTLSSGMIRRGLVGAISLIDFT